MIENYLYIKFFDKLKGRELLTDHFNHKYICHMPYAELIDNIADIISYVICNSNKYNMYNIFDHYDGHLKINIVDTDANKCIGYFLLDTLNPYLILYNISNDWPWLICNELNMIGDLKHVSGETLTLAHDITSKLTDEEQCWLILNRIELDAISCQP